MGREDVGEGWQVSLRFRSVLDRGQQSQYLNRPTYHALLSMAKSGRHMSDQSIDGSGERRESPWDFPHLVSDVTQGEDAQPARPAVSSHLVVLSGPALRKEPALDVRRASGVRIRLAVPVRPRLFHRKLDKNLQSCGRVLSGLVMWSDVKGLHEARNLCAVSHTRPNVASEHSRGLPRPEIFQLAQRRNRSDALCW